MSCYGWERGEVKLPTSDWKQTRDTIYSNYNAKLDELLQEALEIHKEVSQEKKGKRNFNIKESINNKLKNQERFTFNQLIIDSLLTNNKLVKPKKKDFSHKKASKGEILIDEDLEIIFNNKTKTIEYCTDENNHSVDRARDSFLGSLFFRRLKYIKFTTKTGGYLKSQTEYDTDKGLGARVTSTWGKYTKPKYFKEISCFCR
jgi:hypothetical protein